MAIRFLMSGGNFIASNINVAGVWASANGGVDSSINIGRATNWGFTGNNYKTPNLGGNFSGMIAGEAVYNLIIPNQTLIGFQDSNSLNQCTVGTNGTGQFFCARNGTSLAGTGSWTPSSGFSNATFIPGATSYVEFKANFSTSGTGTCEVRLNGVVILSGTGLTNATTTATAAQVLYQNNNSGGSNARLTDFYALDVTSPVATGYLGDVTVAEIFDNGAGTNSQWSQATNNGGTGSPPPFALTSCNNATGGNTVYNRTVTATGETANAYQGYYFVITGFVTHAAANNGTFLCTASSTTTLTLINPNGVAETVSASAAFQNIVQAGIHGGIVDNGGNTNVGTRPNGDAAYIVDSTLNHISDFSHQSLTLTGSILGVVRQTSARKDDAGSRTFAIVTVQGGSVTRVSSTFGLTNVYTFYQDVMEVDPTTGNLWTVSTGGTNFNNTTFGVKQLT